MGNPNLISRYFLGSAFVQVQCLSYLRIDSWPDDCVGCCSSGSHHNIPVLITSSQYQTAIADAGIIKSTLFEFESYPRLVLSQVAKLPYLHGEARIKGILLDTSRNDEWICVDLYQAEIPFHAKRLIRECSRKHLALRDGDIYLRIRIYQRRQDQREAERWMARLTRSKQKVFGQLRRNSLIATVLDKLEVFPALWYNFQLGSFPPLLSWRCYEEISAYLGLILHTWKAICGDHHYWCDEYTLGVVEGLAPQWSLQHKTIIEGLARRGQLFCRVEHQDDRVRAVHRLLEQKGFILTFATFYKHTKRLETTMLGVRQLFPSGKPRPTVVTALRSSFMDTNTSQALVQYSEDDERNIEVSGLNTFEIAYLQIILFGQRNRDDMAAPKTREQWSKASEPPNWLVRLASLASRLGFESEEIMELRRFNPDQCRIRQHMHLEKPQTAFTVTLEDFEREASRRYQRQRIFTPRAKNGDLPLMATAGTDLSPQESLQKLFLPSIVDAVQQVRCGQILTHFGNEVLVICAFYNHLAQEIGRMGEGQSSKIRSDSIADHGLPRPYTSTSPLSSYSRPASEVPAGSQVETSKTPRSHAQSDTEPVLGRVRRISFFQLRAGQPPSLSHSCRASAEEVASVISELKRLRKTTFLLFHHGRFMISPIQAVHRNCVERRRLSSVYYVTDAESLRFCVGKSMKDAKQWGSYYIKETTR